MVCSVTRSKVKVKVTSSWKSEILPLSKAISSPHLQLGLANDHGFLNLGPKAYRGWIFDVCPIFSCYVTLKLAVSRSRPPVLYGANLFLLSLTTCASTNCTLHSLTRGEFLCRTECTDATPSLSDVDNNWTSLAAVTPALCIRALVLETLIFDDYYW